MEDSHVLYHCFSFHWAPPHSSSNSRTQMNQGWLHIWKLVFQPRRVCLWWSVEAILWTVQRPVLQKLGFKLTHGWHLLRCSEQVIRVIVIHDPLRRCPLLLEVLGLARLFKYIFIPTNSDKLRLPYFQPFWISQLIPTVTFQGMYLLSLSERKQTAIPAGTLTCLWLRMSNFSDPLDNHLSQWPRCLPLGSCS